ncbi:MULTISPECIES: hypothetical protein [unclassified Roseofilum]|uniref:hypothetical protein n=1 Tax=unclassified Roseofilum TaxID=2620099 RepID=UPI000E9991A2|nr:MULTISPECIES: hypothetical protein [unclassified Roseofilum]HBQ99675.1 hypothetical protein [Cyanobacteria bacterium UBA11691]MBP0011269.1 hypothetical protein [Roseofilum sp. Belize Diploria]MBP0012136.1 hypothetical protein [Roseofilum sp. SID3]MBP0023940.1 hypothetical protein [Roseofilum sp. SID2]MBP0035743.1 hypothetical protein [Roseofilum sp. Belize BBD 4]
MAKHIKALKLSLALGLVASFVTGFTALVGHDDIFETATGIYPDPMGIAYIIKPDGKYCLGCQGEEIGTEIGAEIV